MPSPLPRRREILRPHLTYAVVFNHRGTLLASLPHIKQLNELARRALSWLVANGCRLGDADKHGAAPFIWCLSIFQNSPLQQSAAPLRHIKTDRWESRAAEQQR